MSFELPLSQDDKNILNDEKEAVVEQNKSIEESSATIITEIAKLLLVDIPFKKKLDPLHVDIFAFEEELRRLNGISILQPLQERGFTISSTSGNEARLFINDGRLIINDNNNEILNIPLFPVSGYSKSQPAGKNFDIWSRDRFGSTTSQKNIATLFPIDMNFRKLAVKFDRGFDTEIDVEIDLSQVIEIQQTDEPVIAETSGNEVSASLNNVPVLENSEILRLVSNPDEIREEAIVETSGEEENFQIQTFPIEPDSEVISFTQVEGARFFDLQKDVHYTINYLTGLVEFKDSEEVPVSIESGFNVVISYRPQVETKVLQKNIDYTIDYNTGLITFLNSLEPQNELVADYNNQVLIAGATLSSSIQSLLQESHPSLETCSCSFNEVIKTFTISSSHGGPSASVEVIQATSNDLKTIIGFDRQFKVQGKYQNNLLNVEIDGEAAQIEISDNRLCFEDSELGYNNDDLGIDWTGSLSIPLGYMGNDRVGPLFCSGINNGKEVASSIEAQLRMVGKGGFKDAIVKYYSLDETFKIFSGSMGTSSSVQILPASDPNRDVRGLIGFELPQEERGNEEFFETLQKLYDRISQVPDILVSNLNNPSFLSHSILYTQPSGVNIQSDFQDFDCTTTKIYDDGSRGLPRLYPDGKIIIDNTNDKIDFFEELNKEKSAIITHGIYKNETLLAEAITSSLNSISGGPQYLCEFDLQTKKFKISSSLTGGKIFTLLFNSGRNVLNSIACHIGFNIDSDKFGSGIYISDRETSFISEDFFNPVFVSQFNGTPKVIDQSEDELSAIIKEEEFLQDENSLSFLDIISSTEVFENEVILNSWKALATLELEKVNQEFSALRYQKGAYGNHISENDLVIQQKTIAYDNLKINRDNLLEILDPDSNFLNLSSNSKTFVPNNDFFNGGVENLSFSIDPINNKRVYNSPAPFVKFLNDPKQIPGRFSNPNLLTSLLSFIPEQLSAFKITCIKTGIDEFGHTIDSAKLTINDTRLIVEYYWSDNGGGSRIDLDIDLTISPNNNILGLISTINSNPDYNAKIDYAYLLGRVSEKIKVQNGDSLIINVNGTGEQTVIFNSTGGTSISGSYPWTRTSESNNKLRLIIDNLSAENTVFDEPLIGSGISFVTQNSPIKKGSTSIYCSPILIGGGGTGPVSLPFTLVENTDYTINYSTGQITLNTNVDTSIYSIMIDYIYYSGIYEITLGTQLTPEAIASKIQQEVRGLINSNLENQMSLASFSCQFLDGKYILSSGMTGTNSKVHIYNSLTNDIAVFLKLGLDNGGEEVEGTGDYENSNFVSIDEIVDKINSEVVGIIASGPNYLKLISTTLGNSSNILISDTLLAKKLGFDKDINNYSYPFIELSNVNSSTIKNISNIEILIPVEYTVLRGWETQKGNIEISFYTIDNEKISNRKQIILNRLAFIPTRKSQITSRANEIISILQNIDYELRKQQVRNRLNKKTGSYIKIGDKFAQQESNEETIQSNNNFISLINQMLQ